MRFARLVLTVAKLKNMWDGMVDAGIYKEKIKICWVGRGLQFGLVTQNVGYWSETRGDIIRTMIDIGFPTFGCCFFDTVQ